MAAASPWRSALPEVAVGGATVPDLVLRHADRLSDKPALVDGPTGRTLGYRQLAGGVERVAPDKRVRAVRITDSVPRSPSGKLLRRLLVEAERAGSPAPALSPVAAGPGVVGRPTRDGARRAARRRRGR
jgi:hypothetical protein